MDINELYGHLLRVGGLQADKEGLVSIVIGKESKPYTIEGKRLVLPLPEQLATGGWDQRIVFHPLSENILRGESKIMERFRGAINLKLNWVIGKMAEELLALTVDVNSHPRMSPDQGVLLTQLLGADQKLFDKFALIMKAMGMGDKDKAFVHIFLKRGGMVGGKKFNRACIVSFPFYEELCKDEKTVYGVPISGKARGILRALMEFLLPGIQVANSFDVGSVSDIAPFLDALMQGVKRIAISLNDVLDAYAEFFPNVEDYRIDDNWVEVFDNLSTMLSQIRDIPMQAGNEGGGATPAPVQPTVERHTPAATPGAAAHAPAGRVTMPHAPVAQHAPRGTVAMPAPVVTPQGQPAGTPGVVYNADGSINMAATRASNPQLNAQFNNGYSGYGMQPVIPPGPDATRNARPLWDQPAPYQHGGYGGGGYGGGYGGGRI